MARTLMEKSILNYRGLIFKVPRRDEIGEVVWTDASKQIPEWDDATTSRILYELIAQIPAQLLTNQDTIHGGRLYNQLWECTRRGSNILTIEDAEWDWALKKIEDDRIGPKLFGMSNNSVVQQLKELASLESKGKGEKDLTSNSQLIALESKPRAQRRRKQQNRHEDMESLAATTKEDREG